MASNRDDFSRATKRAVALRAGYRCSICRRPTVGPSGESPSAVTLVGEAAHIHAAAPGPGARRYLASMTPGERSDVSNAIWLCATHARLIDRDEATHTAKALRRIKSEHEGMCARELRSVAPTGGGLGELVALGPELTFVGELVGGVSNEWALAIRYFLEGDLSALMRFTEDFDDMPAHLRYVLAESIGDGRVLAEAPAWTRDDGGLRVRCKVRPGTGRTRADRLGADLMLSDRNDLVIEDGALAITSGLASLPQKLKLTLSLKKGETALDPDAGTRLAEHYALLRDSRWFDGLVKLEVIRMAAIPSAWSGTGIATTPLRCVRRVLHVRATREAIDGWLPVDITLDVEGVGEWGRRIDVYVGPGRRDRLP